MITIIITSGLIILTLAVTAWYNKKIALAALIPLCYAGYYVIATEVPKYFGYAISANFAEMKNQARFLSAFETQDKIYLLIVEKDVKEPRLISVQSTEENKKVVKELQEKAKAGVAVLRKSSSKPKSDKAGNASISSKSDIESVEMKDQNIISKGTP